MIDPAHVLAAASRTTAVASPLRAVLVCGGGGALGSAVLEALLGSGRFAAVGVLVARRMAPTLRGLQAVDAAPLAMAAFAPDTAVIVYDRVRHANGRDDAFIRPQPDALVEDAMRLRDAGVRRLLVAVPHAPALLPQALRQGLASLDEGAVAGLGFEQLVFMRLAQASAAPGKALPAPQRLAAWLLRQLHWMIPSSEQPVRVATVAGVVAEVLTALAAAPQATRVLPHELLWHAAQTADVAPLVTRWLAGQPLPPLRSVQRRW